MERGEQSPTEAMTAPSPRGELTQEVTPHRGAAIPFNWQVGHPSQRPLHAQSVCLKTSCGPVALTTTSDLSPPQTHTKRSRGEEKRRGTFVSDTSCRGREVL